MWYHLSSAAAVICRWKDVLASLFEKKKNNTVKKKKKLSLLNGTFSKVQPWGLDLEVSSKRHPEMFQSIAAAGESPAERTRRDKDEGGRHNQIK